MSGGKCTYCPEGASVGKAIVALTGVMAILFLIFALLFMRAKEEKEEDKNDKDNKKRKNKAGGGINKTKRPDAVEQTKRQKIEAQNGKNAAIRVVGDQALIGRMQGSGGKEVADGTTGLDEAYRSDSQVVTDRIKIVYGWLQIFTALTFTFDIPW